MSEELFKPTPDPSKSEESKSAEERRRQGEEARARLTRRGNEGAPRVNPVTTDETYGGLREENRVVMRHTIALNLDSFRASSDEFAPARAHDYPPLQPAAAPFFSVVVPNFNGRRFLPTLFDALRRQSLRDFEVILADDASGDDSVALTERLYPEVRLVVNRRNLGFVGACNTAADAARGRVLVLLNNDTEPEPNWLEELARVLVANPQAATVASKLLLYDRRDTLHSAGDLLGRNGIPANRGVWEKDRGQYDEATDVFSGCGGAVAYRRDVWATLGGFDPDFWMYLEDVDYGFRARLAGFSAVFAPNARVYHHLSASGGDTLASYYVGRNTIWMIAKNRPGPLLARPLPAILGAQRAVTWDALRNVGGAAARARLRGQLAGLLGLPAQLRKRRAVQARLAVEPSELSRNLT